MRSPGPPSIVVRRLLLLLGTVLVLTSVVAPIVSWTLTGLVGDVHRLSFPRVYDRTLQIVAVVAFVLTRRWLGLTTWAAVGLGDPARRRDVYLGLGVAFAGMALLLGCLYWADALRFFWRYDLAKGVRKAAAGMLGAVLIGVGEELFFRGILLGGLMREMGRGAAVAWTTVVYAVVHFLRGGKHPGPVTWGSGFERVAGAFTPLADPGIVPALVGFLLLGLLLAYARLRSGGLYLSIGLHIGLVAVLRVGRLVMDFPREPGLFWGLRRPPLVSGVAGWIALLAMFAVVARLLRSRPPP